MASLELLPCEVFARICLYLRATDLIVLHQASSRLRVLLRPSFWKKRLMSLCCTASYPCIIDERFKWMKAAIEREKFIHVFAHERRNAIYYSGPSRRSNVVIDAMHIPKVAPNVLFVGDRARTLLTFALNFPVDQNGIPSINCKLTNRDSRSHSGWIWTIDSCDKTVLSGSWDGYLHIWSLSDTGLDLLSKLGFNTAVLCSMFLGPHTVAVGLPTAQARVLDLRAPPSAPANYGLRLPHKGAVICMAGLLNDGDAGAMDGASLLDFGSDGDLEDDLTISPVLSSLSSSLSSLVVDMRHGSGDSATSCDVLDRLNILLEHQQQSERKHTPVSELQPPERCDEEPPGDTRSSPNTYSSTTAAVTLFTGCSDQFMYGWDLRNLRTSVVQYKFERHPRRISILPSGELWVAETPNRIHLFDTRHGRLDHLHMNELPGWTRGFGGLVATPGCVIACGLHGSVEAFHPTRPLVPMSATPVVDKMDSPATSLTVRDDLVAVGTGDGLMHFWTSPEHAHRNS